MTTRRPHPSWCGSPLRTNPPGGSGGPYTLPDVSGDVSQGSGDLRLVSRFLSSFGLGPLIAEDVGVDWTVDVSGDARHTTRSTLGRVVIRESFPELVSVQR